MVVQDTVFLRAESLLHSVVLPKNCKAANYNSLFFYIFVVVVVVVTQRNDFWKYRGFVGVQNCLDDGS